MDGPTYPTTPQTTHKLFLTVHILIVFILFVPSGSATVLSYHKSGEQIVALPPTYNNVKDSTVGYTMSNGVLETNVYLFLWGGLYTGSSWWDLESIYNLSEIDIYNYAATGQTLYFYGSNISSSSDFVYLGQTTHTSGWKNTSVSGNYRYIRFYASSGGGFQTSEIVIQGTLAPSNTISTDKANYNYSETVTISYTYLTNYSFPIDSFYIAVLSGSEPYFFTDMLPVGSIYQSPFNLPINLSNGNYTAKMYKWTDNSLLAATYFNITNYTPPVPPTPYPTPTTTITPYPTYQPTPDINYTSYNGTDGLGNMTGNAGNITNNSLGNINNITDDISWQISSYNYSASKSVYKLFLPSILNIFPPKLWLLIILGWSLEIALIVIKR